MSGDDKVLFCDVQYPIKSEDEEIHIERKRKHRSSSTEEDTSESKFLPAVKRSPTTDYTVSLTPPSVILSDPLLFNTANTSSACDHLVTPIDEKVRRDTCNTDFQEKVLSLLTSIKEQNEELLAYFRKVDRTSALYVCSLPEDLPINFPLATKENLIKLEEYLQISDHMNAVVSYLASLGGKGTSQVNRILKFLLTNEVASTFSYFGSRGGKDPFTKLHLKTAIFRAIKLSSADFTEKSIEDAIKVWLKHAAQRLAKLKQSSSLK